MENITSLSPSLNTTSNTTSPAPSPPPFQAFDALRALQQRFQGNTSYTLGTSVSFWEQNIKNVSMLATRPDLGRWIASPKPPPPLPPPPAAPPPSDHPSLLPSIDPELVTLNRINASLGTLLILIIIIHACNRLTTPSVSKNGSNEASPKDIELNTMHYS